ncbi:acyl carrier protein [Flexibacterium corallicola]|uniref:acyl carrier protein n=1 Tax=Flexibacterium corallicola TaxID=3037259 RepID=UPI00286ECE15|nr:acyl carrier protein [Pseudovibrio sp. M1P-2-3]
MDVFNVVSQIIVDVLDEDDLIVTKETVADDAEDWDSLAQIQIIDALEKELKIKFSLQEIEQLNASSNVGNTVDLISRKISAH